MINSPTSLSVSCVYFDTQTDIFENTLSSLARAIDHAKKTEAIDTVELHLINNNPQKEDVFEEICAQLNSMFEELTIHNGHGNIGYGRGNNLAINQISSKYHLILNPDVELSPNALTEGIQFLDANNNVCLVAPHATNQENQVEYLAKRQPTLLIILLRGLNIPFLKKLFKDRLEKYAYMDLIPNENPVEIELASGCFMLCRTETLKMCGGFSPEYFLYFEDFDLSKKLRRYGKLFYLPSMQIVHLGGKAAKKGIEHIYLFLKSASRFFLTHNSIRVKSGKNTDE